MKINKSYPYPVLDKDGHDYKNSSFSTNIDINQEFGKMKFNILHNLKNQLMEKLIEKKKLVFVIHIECSKTSFREKFSTFESCDSFQIPDSKISGKVEIRSLILANEDLSNYQNEDLDDWYKAVEVNYKKGNILAIADTLDIDLPDKNILELNLPSIVNIGKKIDAEYLEVEFSQDMIAIHLPESDYETYRTYANSNSKNTILSLVIVPTLIYVFSELKNSHEEYEEYAWYKVASNILKKNQKNIKDVGSDNFSSLQAAQLIIQGPITRAFNELNNIYNMEV